MSLFVGNLAPGVRKDELETMFRKFGWCTVLMKGNYGFVLYASPHHAERALRELQDTYILGEKLILDWSKQQCGWLQDSRRGCYRERIAGRDREGRRGKSSVSRELSRRSRSDERSPARNGDDNSQRRRRKETEFVKEEYSSRRKEKSSASSSLNSVRNTSRSNSKFGSSNHKRGCYSRSVSSRAHSQSSSSRSRLLRRNEMGREEIERSRSRPRKRMRYSKDSGPASRELSRRSTSVGRSPARNGDDNSQRNSYEDKMRRRKEPGFVKEYRRRKEKRLVPYSSDSDSNTPSSNLKSRSYNHRRGRYYSRSSSRSVSSRSHSASSSSRSRLLRRNSRYNGLKSRSRMVEVDVLSEDAKPGNRQQATNDKLPTSPSLLAQLGLAHEESSESSGSEDDTGRKAWF